MTTELGARSFAGKPRRTAATVSRNNCGGAVFTGEPHREVSTDSPVGCCRFSAAPLVADALFGLTQLFLGGVFDSFGCVSGAIEWLVDLFFAALDPLTQ